MPIITSTPPEEIYLNEEFQYIIEVDDPDNTEFIFDLSDSSLSYTISATSYPAFNFDFYN